MSGKIQKDDFIDSEAIKEALADILAAMKAITEEGKNLKLFIDGAKSFKEIGDANDKITENVKKRTSAEIELEKTIKKLVITQGQLEIRDKELALVNKQNNELTTETVRRLAEKQIALKKEKEALIESITGTKAAAAAKKAAIQEEKAAIASLRVEQAARLAADKAQATQDKSTIAAAKKANLQEEKAMIAALRVEQKARIEVDRLKAVEDKKAIAIQNARTQGMAKEWQANWKLYQAEKQRTELVPKTVSATSNLMSSLKGLINSYIGITALIMGVQRLIKEVFNVTKKLDALDFAVKQVITSESELAQTEVWLLNTSVKYGAEIINLTERYIKFRAAAIQANLSAFQTQQIFGTMTKAAGVLGLKTDETAGIFLALEQMLSKGKVTTEELRRQLGERLPGAFGLMAEALGVTLPQLDKMLRAGEVLSATALPKLAVEIEKAFGSKVTGDINTLQASVARLKTSWIELVDELAASKFFKALVGVTNLFVEGIGDLYRGLSSKKIRDFGEEVDNVAGIIIKIAENEAAIKYFNDVANGMNVAAAQSQELTNKIENLKHNGILLESELKNLLSDTNSLTNGTKKLLNNTEFYNNSIEDQLKTVKKLAPQDREHVRQILIKQNAIKMLNNEIQNNIKLLEDMNNFDYFSSGELDDAEKEFTDYNNLKTDAAREDFLNNASYIKKEQTDYKKMLLARLSFINSDINVRKTILEAARNKYKEIQQGGTQDEINEARKAAEKKYAIYKESIEERIAIELKLRQLEGGGTKDIKQKDDSLAILKAKNAQELAMQDEFQQSILLGQRAKLRDTIDNEFELDEALIKLDEENNLNLLGLAIKLQEDLVKITKEGSKERESEEERLAELKADIIRKSNDYAIAEEERRLKEEERLRKQRLEIAESSIEVDAIGEETDALTEHNKRLAEIYNERFLSKERTDEKIKNAEIELQKELFKIQMNALLAKQKLYENDPIELARVQEDIKKLQLAQADFEIKIDSDKAKIILEAKELQKEKLKELASEVFNFASALSDRALEMAARQRDREIDLAGDSAEKKMAAENKYNDEVRKIKTKQAKLDRAQALFNIALNTAVAVTKITAEAALVAPFLIPAIIALGALQAAAVLAAPIPQFKEGGTMQEEGVARVSEEGRELRIDKHGNVSLTPESESLMHLGAGDTIIPHRETERILADAAMNNFVNDTLDLSNTNLYLRQIRDKEQVVYANGYKYVNKRGLKGRYATRV